MPESAARLIVRDARGNEREVEISRSPFTLGRQSDNDLVLLDNRISRQHARIVQGPEGYTIEDASSRHGTFVNGERVTQQPLKNTDQINLGVSDAYRLTFLMEGAVLPELLEQIGRATDSRAPQLQHLGLLLQVAQVLHRASALEEVLTKLLDSAIQLTEAERGLLFLANEEGEIKLRLARSNGSFLPLDQVTYSPAILERVVRERREELVVEDELTGRTAQETGVLPAKAHGVVAVPLQKLQVTDSSGDTIRQTLPQLQGVLYLEARLRLASVTGLDRQVLQTLAVEGATVIENARLLRRAREQERTQHELTLASTIQQSLLPRSLPQTSYFKLYALTRPSRTVGGDYYDVVPLPGGRFGLTVADVSGKGWPAAMMSVMLQGSFDAVAAGDPGLDELFHRVNDFLCERTPPEMYATVFYGVLDPSGRFDFVNAAHPAPLVLHPNGECTLLGSSNFPIGMFPGVEFTRQSAQLHPGDEIVIFSDGVTEAQNTTRDFFGDARLTEALKCSTGMPLQERCTRLVEAVENFAGLAPQADDITVVLMRFAPET
ncbi:MAG TPA: SpoIIE family protein phosphatase [Terriglobia bacterium]|jgi:sigma-B regulation protein RsbU (phosphoserine phosphatase)|nr:SpoIIE family protein phosphatase [Terriglobia bacterium]